MQLLHIKFLDKRLVLPLLACLLAACVKQQGVLDSPTATGFESGGTYALTDSEIRLREQNDNYSKTIWQGAAAGAAIGALFGLLQGDDSRGVVIKAAAGAAVGGLAGAYVAEKQKQYAEEEDQLDAIIADLQASNEETRQLIASARIVLEEDKRRLAEINRKHQADLATETEVKQARERAEKNRTEVVDATETAEKRLAMFEGTRESYQDADPTQSEALNDGIDTFKEHVVTLDSIADQYKLS